MGEKIKFDRDFISKIKQRKKMSIGGTYTYTHAHTHAHAHTPIWSKSSSWILC